MSPHEIRHIRLEGIIEIISGKRGIIKSNNLLLPLAVLVFVNKSINGLYGLVVFFAIFAVVVCWSLACIFINDIADRTDDTRVGKRRWIWKLPAGHAVSFVLFLVGFGVLVLLLFDTLPITYGAYGAALLLGIFYSVKPFRGKERGLLGLVVYSLSCTIAFVVIPWTWIGRNPVTLGILCPAVFLDKWVNLHFHQVVDYTSDKERDTTTFAVRQGLESARTTLYYGASAASVAFIVVGIFLLLNDPWLLSPVALSLLIAAGLSFIVWYMQRKRQKKGSALIRELPWFYLGLTYAMLRVAPFLIFIILAQQDSFMWGAVVWVAALLVIESWHSLHYNYE